MQASSSQEVAAKTCDSCGTGNGDGARFCKQCGGALVAPPECPACRVAVAPDARFCSGCGVKLVGMRHLSLVPPAADASSSRASGEVAKVEGATKPSDADETTRPASPLREHMANLPPPRPRGSSVVGNVLLFFAALAVFVVGMYVWNKDKEKVESPFNAPPASQMARPAPPVAAPAAGGEAAPAAAAPASGGPIHGVIKLDPALEKPAGGTVFIILRNAGMPERGPPIAAKKIDSPSFPLEFEIGPADVMQGMPYNGPFDLSVRLDADGNAMTKEPGDLTVQAPKSGVTAGSTGVEIVLDKRL